MTRKPGAGFIPVGSIRRGPPDPAEALAQIRRIYFTTTPRTIEHDLAHAIELLAVLPTEEQREKASVFMAGLNEMRKEWQRASRAGARPARKQPAPARRRRS
jgi:hypothetical protein